MHMHKDNTEAESNGSTVQSIKLVWEPFLTENDGKKLFTDFLVSYFSALSCGGAKHIKTLP